jgi:hypothetical protein
MPTRRLPWTRDEIILATDLYLRVDRRVPDSTDPLVIEVCDIINALPLDSSAKSRHGMSSTRESFDI